MLTLIWMAARVRIDDNHYIDALSVMAYMIPFLFSMRYTYLKDRPASVQAVFIGGFTLVLTSGSCSASAAARDATHLIAGTHGLEITT